MADQYDGIVKWYNSEKGFGFIQRENGEEDIFVHHSEINHSGYGKASLNDGQKVIFEIGENGKRTQAKNVKAF